MNSDIFPDSLSAPFPLPVESEKVEERIYTQPKDTTCQDDRFLAQANNPATVL